MFSYYPSGYYTPSPVFVRPRNYYQEDALRAQFEEELYRQRQAEHLRRLQELKEQEEQERQALLRHEMERRMRHAQLQKQEQLRQLQQQRKRQLQEAQRQRLAQRLSQDWFGNLLNQEFASEESDPEEYAEQDYIEPASVAYHPAAFQMGARQGRRPQSAPKPPRQQAEPKSTFQPRTIPIRAASPPSAVPHVHPVSPPHRHEQIHHHLPEQRQCQPVQQQKPAFKPINIPIRTNTPPAIKQLPTPDQVNQMYLAANARRIQRTYRTHLTNLRIAQPKLSLLSSVSTQLDDLIETAKPTALSAPLKLTPDGSLVLGAKENMPLLGYEEQLVKFMITVDAIESAGSSVVRERRREVVRRIQEELDGVDRRKKEVAREAVEKSEGEGEVQNEAVIERTDSGMEVEVGRKHETEQEPNDEGKDVVMHELDRAVNEAELDVGVKGMKLSTDMEVDNTSKDQLCSPNNDEPAQSEPEEGDVTMEDAREPAETVDETHTDPVDTTPTLPSNETSMDQNPDSSSPATDTKPAISNPDFHDPTASPPDDPPASTSTTPSLQSAPSDPHPNHANNTAVETDTSFPPLEQSPGTSFPPLEQSPGVDAFQTRDADTTAAPGTQDQTPGSASPTAEEHGWEMVHEAGVSEGKEGEVGVTDRGEGGGRLVGDEG